MFRLMLSDLYHSGTVIEMLLYVGIIVYLNLLPYIMALDKVLHCRHICLHDIFWIFYCVFLTLTLDVSNIGGCMVNTLVAYAYDLVRLKLQLKLFACAFIGERTTLRSLYAISRPSVVCLSVVCDVGAPYSRG